MRAVTATLTAVRPVSEPRSLSPRDLSRGRVDPITVLSMLGREFEISLVHPKPRSPQHGTTMSAEWQASDDRRNSSVEHGPRANANCLGKVSERAAAIAIFKGVKRGC
jgi:hypothetical protein